MAPDTPSAAAGKTPNEAMRCLKRRLSDIVYRNMLGDVIAASASKLGTGSGDSRRQSTVRVPPARLVDVGRIRAPEVKGHAHRQTQCLSEPGRFSRFGPRWHLAIDKPQVIAPAKSRQPNLVIAGVKTA